MMNHSQGKAFLSGFALATAAYYLIGRNQRCGSSSSAPNVSHQDKEASNSSKKSSKETNTRDEMDSPDLPLRMVRKAEAVILNRTSRVVVVIERCTDDHNYSAILRTAEALGIQNLWIISPPKISEAMMASDDDALEDFVQESSSNTDLDEPEAVNADDANGWKKVTKKKTKQKIVRSTGQVVKNPSQTDIKMRLSHHLFAKRATEWLTIREFDSTSSCLKALREDNRTIWATDLSQHADCLTREGLMGIGQEDSGDVLPKKLAIVFGTESVGCTNEMLTGADRRVYLPLQGYADSLNLSVATALCLLQLFHLSPDIVGDMSEDERRGLRKKWYAKLATQRLQTNREKKNRVKLMSNIKQLEETELKGMSRELQDEQKEKLKKLPEYRSELAKIDQNLAVKAEAAVKDLVENPPAPLSDVRRADEHRVCYVGPGTRKKNSENWADMPATGNYGGSNVKSSEEFRARAEAGLQDII